MALIYKDELGLYCFSGGYIARPFKTTNLVMGEKHKAKHNSGTCFHTIGDETWIGCGISTEDKTLEQKTKARDWYFDEYSDLVEIEY